MAIDARRALREGVDDLASTRGAVLSILLTVYTVATLPLHQTLVRTGTDWLIEEGGLPPEDIITPVTPLATDIGLQLLFLGMVGSFVVGEGLRFVAVRSFASDSATPIPSAEVLENWLHTFGILIVASLLVTLLVYAGLGVFVVPGAIVFVLTLFVRQAILIDGEGVVGSLKRSIVLVADNVTSVLLIVVAFVLISMVAAIPGVLLGLDDLGNSISRTIFGTVGTVYSIAVLTRAYQHADEVDESGEGGETDENYENDDEAGEDRSAGDPFEETADR